MSATIRITRAGPMATIQDSGRLGALHHGISASGPMDRGAFDRAGAALGNAASEGIEFTQAGLAFTVAEGHFRARADGGEFALSVNGSPRSWPVDLGLSVGDIVDITPGPAGNYGYLRFDHAIDVPVLIGSRSTNLVAGLGGLEGRALRRGDVLGLLPVPLGGGTAITIEHPPVSDGPIRFVWGLHADLFAPPARQAFLDAAFVVSSRLDRMGVRLGDPHSVFAGSPILSLVSDAIVPGDIQILGDGTPIVLMRDHQPTGGYPRIATVVSADLDRFAQMRPGTSLAFVPVGLQKARAFYLASQRP